MTQAYTAHLLALAGKKLFPQAQLAGGEINPPFFAYRFRCPPFPEEVFLPIFEEAVRGFLKAPLKFKVQEMVLENGADFLEDQGEPLLADLFLDKIEQAGHLLIGGGTVQILIEPFEHETVYFKILKIERKEDEVEVTGVSFKTQEDLKNFLKIWKLKEKKGVHKEGPKKKWVVFDSEGNPSFLPAGIKFQEEIKNKFDNFGLPVLLHEKTGSTASLCYEALKPKEDPYILYDGESHYVFDKKERLEETLNSSLQTILKTVKLWDFEAQVTLNGLRPPKNVSEWVKELWHRGAKGLKNTLSDLKIPFICSEGEFGERLKPIGPGLHVSYHDSLGMKFQGPWLTLDCVESEKLKKPGTERILVIECLNPGFDTLVLKKMEQTIFLEHR